MMPKSLKILLKSKDDENSDEEITDQEYSVTEGFQMKKNALVPKIQNVIKTKKSYGCRNYLHCTSGSAGLKVSLDSASTKLMSNTIEAMSNISNIKGFNVVGALGQN